MRPLAAPVVSFDVHGHWNRIVVSGRDLPPTREIARLFRDTPQLARPSRSSPSVWFRRAAAEDLAERPRAAAPRASLAPCARIV